MELFAAALGFMPGQTFLEWIATTVLLRGTHANRPAANTVSIGTEYYATNTQLRWKSDGTSWQADSPSPAGQVQKGTITLTNAQIKALPTTGIEILPAPDTNEVYVPIYMTLGFAWTADYTNIDGAAVFNTQYTSNDDLFMAQLHEATYGDLTNLLAQGEPRFARVPPYAQINEIETTLRAEIKQWTDLKASPVRVKMLNGAAGDLTGGHADNTLQVTIYYAIDQP